MRAVARMDESALTRTQQRACEVPHSPGSHRRRLKGAKFALMTTCILFSELRVEELEVSRETIDHVSGLQSGYSSKILAPVPLKRVGSVTLGLLLSTLGLKLVVAEDREALAALRHRMPAKKGSWSRGEPVEPPPPTIEEMGASHDPGAAGRECPPRRHCPQPIAHAGATPPVRPPCCTRPLASPAQPQENDHGTGTGLPQQLANQDFAKLFKLPGLRAATIRSATVRSVGQPRMCMAPFLSGSCVGWGFSCPRSWSGLAPLWTKP